jgi:hypothetical protein
MPRKFIYGPGLPGYGTAGTDGSSGLTGLGVFFSAYDGNSDTVTIKGKIIANKELFSNDVLIPGYPARTYQTGDIFIDKNARVFQIDFAESNLYKDTGIFLNTSGFFSEGPPQVNSPGFQRYSNAFETEKFLIDVVYTNSVGDYTQYPFSIYGNSPSYFGRVSYIGDDIISDLNGWYPFEIWTIGNNISGKDAIALARKSDINEWHFGNWDASIRDSSLYLDFNDIYCPSIAQKTVESQILFWDTETGRISYGAPASGMTMSNWGTSRIVTSTSETTLNAEANLTFDGTVLTMGGQSIVTSGNGLKSLQLGNGRTDSDQAYIDLIGDTTYSDYGLRIIRNSTGPNTTSELIHRGSGNFVFQAANDSHLLFTSKGAESLNLYDGVAYAPKLGVGFNNGVDAVFHVESAFGGGAICSKIINTSTTGYGLQVQNGSDNFASILVLNALGNSNNIQLYGSGDGFFLGRILAGNGTVNSPSLTFVNESDSGFYRDGVADRISLSIGGSESFRFDVSTFHARGNVIAYSSMPSDIRLKTGIEDLENPLDAVLKFRGVSYISKDTGNKHIGFIAQEVEQFLPDLIIETQLIGKPNNEIYKTIKYTEIIPYLSEAIKAQQKMISDQQDQINILIEEIKKLKK